MKATLDDDDDDDDSRNTKFYLVEHVLYSSRLLTYVVESAYRFLRRNSSPRVQVANVDKARSFDSTLPFGVKQIFNAYFIR